MRRLFACLLTVLVLLGVSAAPADASSYGKNSSSSHSVIYTRPCATISVCKLVVVQRGQSFPRDTEYAMPGFGWKMCPVADPGSPLCFTGTKYRKIDTLAQKYLTWYVSSV